MPDNPLGSPTGRRSGTECRDLQGGWAKRRTAISPVSPRFTGAPVALGTEKGPSLIFPLVPKLRFRNAFSRSFGSLLKSCGVAAREPAFAIVVPPETAAEPVARPTSPCPGLRPCHCRPSVPPPYVPKLWVFRPHFSKLRARPTPQAIRTPPLVPASAGATSQNGDWAERQASTLKKGDRRLTATVFRGSSLVGSGPVPFFQRKEFHSGCHCRRNRELCPAVV